MNIELKVKHVEAIKSAVRRLQPTKEALAYMPDRELIETWLNLNEIIGFVEDQESGRISVKSSNTPTLRMKRLTPEQLSTEKK